MRSIVVDAGPLIGLFYAKDSRHNECRAGFSQLRDTKIIVPLPIVFEVYKWLLQKTHPDKAQKALGKITNSFYLYPLTDETFSAIQEIIVTKLPRWKGSLEDVTVMYTALQQRCPVWTLDYRDLGSFENLEFWNPGNEK